MIGLGINLRELRSRIGRKPQYAHRAAQAQERRAQGSRPDVAIHDLHAPRVNIPVTDRCRSAEGWNKLTEQGLFLARQENWAEIGRLVRALDRSRDQLPDGRASAHAVLQGARSDVVAAGREAAGRQDAEQAHAILSALEDVLEEYCEDHGVALAVALAHVDVAEAWHGAITRRDTPPARRAAYHSHMRRAERILDNFDPTERNSPALAAARCRLLHAAPNPEDRVADDYEDLIDLDPTSALHLRAFGRSLLPRWYGSHDRLEYEARRIAHATQDIWGSGGYTWMYFDALTQDSAAQNHVDAEYFIEGLHDILALTSNQCVANQLAALTGHSLFGARRHETARKRISDSFAWIVRDHLREIHPGIWANAPGGAPCPEDADTTEIGYGRAMHALASHFSNDLESGKQIDFSTDGVLIRAAA